MVDVGLANLKSLVITYVRSTTIIENSSSKWIKFLIFSFLFLITLIHKWLAYWIEATGRLQCSSCQTQVYTKRGSFSRRWQDWNLGIEYAWTVPRYQCRNCHNSFNIFTNTSFAYCKVPPALIVLEPMILFLRKIKSAELGWLQWSNETRKLAFDLSISSFLKKTLILKQLFDLRDYMKTPTSLLFFLRNCLNEKQRRLFLGLFALNLPRGGMKQLHQLTGAALKTIHRGKQELLAQQSSNHHNSPIRLSGGGRKSKVTDPNYAGQVLQLIEDETAGDPMTGLKWTRRSLRKLATALTEIDIFLALSTIARILRHNNYSPKVNSKTKSLKGNHPQRDQQFQIIAAQKLQFFEAGNPIISIDCKKKELIGDYKNPGQLWRQQPFETLDHSFPGKKNSILVPFGIYDLQNNHGFIYCGTNKSTAEFAVEAIVMWWHRHGSKRYPNVNELLLLCDTGGGNAARSYLWKWFIQEKLADELGLTVQICHYPSGTSKWNPIEHRLFSYISLNWAGRPLIDHETALNYIKTTTTTTGLKVDAIMTEKEYQTGLKVSAEQLSTLNITFDTLIPAWNYQIKPRTSSQTTKHDNFWLLKKPIPLQKLDYTCEACSKEFKNKTFSTIENHTWACRKDRFCDNCGKNYKNKLRSSFQNHIWSCGKDHLCPKCGENYRNKTRRSYNFHVWGCKVDRLCSICAKNYRDKTKKNYDIHIKKCKSTKS
ncbi:MAG: hypothetical protein HeimC2_23670 [Candidatus Heimdallarchaeota archaeon LC_2]|nr:MAG: hypothetical protein HeimC2_23670 [Candidatus Heimdallarchaeota archaeon LC_2]